MSEQRKSDHIILPIDDPLGIRKVSLPGSLPSLQVEAKIVVRQWTSSRQNNIDSDKEKVTFLGIFHPHSLPKWFETVVGVRERRSFHVRSNLVWTSQFCLPATIRRQRLLDWAYRRYKSVLHLNIDPAFCVRWLEDGTFALYLHQPGDCPCMEYSSGP